MQFPLSHWNSSISQEPGRTIVATITKKQAEEIAKQKMNDLNALNLEEAVKIMLHVHQKGVGVCGGYTYEVAETKVTQVVDYARKNQHPLQCTLEKD